MIRVRVCKKPRACDSCGKDSRIQIHGYTVYDNEPITRVVDLCDGCALRLHAVLSERLLGKRVA